MSIDDVEARVRTLEVELQKATERSRLAKKAVKDAKVLAKEAKKEKRRARKALIAAQEEQEAALDASQASGGSANESRKVAAAKIHFSETGEAPRPRVRRRAKSKTAPGDASTHETSNVADEPQTPSESTSS